MKFDTELLDEYEICWMMEGVKFEGPDHKEWQCVSREYKGSRRWNEDWTSVFKIDDEFWAVDWEDPSTEMQEDQGHWGYANEVEFNRVYPIEKTVTIYRVLL